MPLFSFTTNHFAPNERLEAAQDTYSALAQVQFRAPKKQIPHIETHIRLLPGVSIARARASSLHALRNSSQVADGNDDITFLIHPGGEGGWLSHLQSHETLACTPGRARIVLNHQSGGIEFHGNRVNLLSVAFPRDRLMPLLSDLGRLPNTLLPSGEALQHLTRLAVMQTQPQSDDAGPSPTQISDQLLDLACLAIGANPEARRHAKRGGLRDARLRAIKADINAHARTPLTLEALALRHRVSPSYIRALFHKEGTSFTDYLVEQRLMRAFDAIIANEGPQRSISDIAFRCGFNHLSWFYRAFKQRFGMPPGELRKIGTDQKGTDLSPTCGSGHGRSHR
ncbi:MAG: AraC family transcriptional regulator [Halomonadaceae bacterium]|nr:MAG: AraC family transcriptional regulator [Halomonadaceae bacterium]